MLRSREEVPLLRIVVCVKQVPVTSEIRFDESTRRIIREGVGLVVNAYDRRAVAAAVALKQLHGGSVTVVTMGPPQAAEALVESLAAGADRAIHLCDAAFAGADTLATARALAAAISRDAFDLVVTGESSTDGETGQVGPELAELLGVVHTTAAAELNVDPATRRVAVRREIDGGFEDISFRLPALVTVSERINRPGLPAPAAMQAAREATIEVLTAETLGDPAQFGRAGSPTWVESIRSNRVERHTIVVSEGTPSEQAAAIANFVGERASHAAAKPATAGDRWPDESTDQIPATQQGQSGIDGPRSTSLPVWGNGRVESPLPVWAVVELEGSELHPVSFELVGQARRLAATLGSEVIAVVLSAGGERFVQALAEHGADRVLAIDHPYLASYQPVPFASALARAISAGRPWLVLAPSTAQGRDYIPRVAAQLQLGLTGDAIGVGLLPDGEVEMLKPAFGGDIVAPIRSATRPAITTIRPGIFAPLPAHTGRNARLDRLHVELDEPPARVDRQVIEVPPSRSIDRAQRIICVGAGLGDRDRLGDVEVLAGYLNAVVGGTRKVVDLGWLPRSQQIGISGRTVSPDLYLALGISGGLNHTVGMSHARTVIAINRDPKAPIARQADLVVVADVADILPALIREFARRPEIPAVRVQ